MEQTNTQEIEERITKQLLGFGWRIWFEPEPDGKVTAVLRDYDSGEIMKTALGDDFEDAYLSLGIDTLPPSDELRREREQRQ